MQEEYLDVVFDGPPSHESGRFVELENMAGRSVGTAEWIDRGDGFWALRITATNIRHGNLTEEDAQFGAGA